MVKEIELTQGKVTLVDDEDYEWLSQWKWSAKHKGKGRYYATRTICYEGGGRKFVQMHRIIMDAKEDEEIDHENRDTLDNQRHNLRPCTTVQNHANYGISSRNKTGYKGVCRPNRISHKEKCYKACIEHLGKKIFLGYFSTAEEAAKVYNEHAIKIFGEFAYLNEIKEGEG